MKTQSQEIQILFSYSDNAKESELSFGHKFICHTWKLLKLYTTETCISVFLHTDNAKESGLKDKMYMLLKPNAQVHKYCFL